MSKAVTLRGHVRSAKLGYVCNLRRALPQPADLVSSAGIFRQSVSRDGRRSACRHCSSEADLRSAIVVVPQRLVQIGDTLTESEAARVDTHLSAGQTLLR